MGRPCRAYGPGTVHHLVARGVRRQLIFLAGEEYQRFLRLGREHLVEEGHTVLAYCLMPNHLHLVVECGEASLSESVRVLLYRYARFWNRRRGVLGHAFQGRHYSKACREDRYLRALFVYVHANPLRAGLARRPSDWPWSSFRAYVGQSTQLPVATTLMSSLFSGRDEMQAAVAALDLEQDDAAAWLWAWTAAMQPDDLHPRELPPRPSLDELVRAVVEEAGVTPAELRGPSREPLLLRARRQISQEAVREHGYSLGEVARAVGRSPSSVCRWLGRAQP